MAKLSKFVKNNRTTTEPGFVLDARQAAEQQKEIEENLGKAVPIVGDVSVKDTKTFEKSPMIPYGVMGQYNQAANMGNLQDVKNSVTGDTNSSIAMVEENLLATQENLANLSGDVEGISNLLDDQVDELNHIKSVVLPHKADLVNGLIPADQIPGSYDELIYLEYATENVGDLPTDEVEEGAVALQTSNLTMYHNIAPSGVAANWAPYPGEQGKMYIVIATGAYYKNQYRWGLNSLVDMTSTPQIASEQDAIEGTNPSRMMAPLTSMKQWDNNTKNRPVVELGGVSVVEAITDVHSSVATLAGNIINLGAEAEALKADVAEIQDKPSWKYQDTTEVVPGPVLNDHPYWAESNDPLTEGLDLLNFKFLPAGMVRHAASSPFFITHGGYGVTNFGFLWSAIEDWDYNNNRGRRAICVDSFSPTLDLFNLIDIPGADLPGGRTRMATSVRPVRDCTSLELAYPDGTLLLPAGKGKTEVVLPSETPGSGNNEILDVPTYYHYNYPDDGGVYEEPAVKIGNHIWCSNNLVAQYKSDGTPFTLISTHPENGDKYNDDDATLWANDTIGCILSPLDSGDNAYYPNGQPYTNKYGFMYDLTAVENGLIIPGWRLPGQAEYDNLTVRASAAAVAHNLPATHAGMVLKSNRQLNHDITITTPGTSDSPVIIPENNKKVPAFVIDYSEGIGDAPFLVVDPSQHKGVYPLVAVHFSLDSSFPYTWFWDGESIENNIEFPSKKLNEYDTDSNVLQQWADLTGLHSIAMVYLPSVNGVYLFVPAVPNHLSIQPGNKALTGIKVDPINDGTSESVKPGLVFQSIVGLMRASNLRILDIPYYQGGPGSQCYSIEMCEKLIDYHCNARVIGGDIFYNCVSLRNLNIPNCEVLDEVPNDFFTKLCDNSLTSITLNTKLRYGAINSETGELYPNGIHPAVLALIDYRGIHITWRMPFEQKVEKYKADLDRYTNRLRLDQMPYFDESFSYGVSFPVGVYGDNNPTCTRIGNMDYHKSLPIQSKMRGCLLNTKGEVFHYLNPNNWNDSVILPNGEGVSVSLDGTMGDVMVEIPEHFRKVTRDGGFISVRLSEYPIEGYLRVSKHYVGAYEASLYSSGSGSRHVCSVVNDSPNYRGGSAGDVSLEAFDDTPKTMLGRPSTNLTLQEFLSYCYNKLIGDSEPDQQLCWAPQDINSINAVTWLYTVEYASKDIQQPFNSVLTPEGFRQGGLGNGVTDFAEWAAFNGNDAVVPCGATNSLGNFSGVYSHFVFKQEAPGNILRELSVPRYRGIENLFGHLYKWVSGLNIINNSTSMGIYRIKDKSDYMEFLSTQGQADSPTLEFLASIDWANGWLVDIVGNSYGDILPFVTTDTLQNDHNFFCDYVYALYNASGNGTPVQMAALYGGNAFGAFSPGLFHFNIEARVQERASYCTTRLMYLPDDKKPNYLEEVVVTETDQQGKH